MVIKNARKDIRKSHTYQEGGGIPQNFFLAFFDELKKELFIKKLLKWANNKSNNINIYNVPFKKKYRKTPETSLFHNFVPKILMIWSTRSQPLTLPLKMNTINYTKISYASQHPQRAVTVTNTWIWLFFQKSLLPKLFQLYSRCFINN